MPEPVKREPVKKAPVKKRAYSSAVRDEQAARTRARILEAAGTLFEAKGYARTSIRAIAEAAGVAVDTVYAVFANKARVLTALIDERLAPPAGVENVMDRPEARAVRDEPDPRRQLHLFASDIAQVSERVRPVYEIMRTAASGDPEMTAVFAEMERYRLANMRVAAGWIAARSPLRVSVDAAAETIFALASPDVARMLCDGRGWSRVQHSEWLEDTLRRSLLPDEP